MSGREIRRVRSTEAEDSPEGDPTGRSPRPREAEGRLAPEMAESHEARSQAQAKRRAWPQCEAGWAEHGKVFSVRGAERFAGSSPALPTTVRLVNAPVVSPSFKGAKHRGRGQPRRGSHRPKPTTRSGVGRVEGKTLLPMCGKAERRLTARTDGHVRRVRSTEAEDSPRRGIQKAEAHNAPKAWSGPNMGPGVHQGKNVAEMRAAVLTRRRCGFDTRPPHKPRAGHTRVAPQAWGAITS